MTSERGMQLTLIGGPTLRIVADGLRILTDPTLDPAGGVYPPPPAELTKTIGPAVAPAEIGPIDLVLLSHDQHADNLDLTGREFLSRVPTVLTTASGAERLGSGAVGLEPGETYDVTTDVGGVRITATPGRHGPPGSEPIVGDVIGFIAEWRGQSTGGLWVSGDTVWYDELEQFLEGRNLGTAVVHLGNVRGPGEAQLTMRAADLASVVATVRPSRIVPVHTDGWAHFSESSSAAAAAVTDDRIRALIDWLVPGVETDLPA